MIKTRQFNATDVRSVLTEVDNDNRAGQSILVTNRGEVPVYLGGDTVSSSNGFILDPGDTFTAVLYAGDKLFARTAAGNVTNLAVMNTGV